MDEVSIDELVYLDSDTPARYLGLNEEYQHKFVILKQPFYKKYMSAIPVNLRPCNAKKIYASMIEIKEGESVLFESNKGLCRDKVSIDMGRYFIMESGFKLNKNKAFIYATGIFDRHMQDESTIFPAVQDKANSHLPKMEE